MTNTAQPMRIAVGIATTGRREVMATTISHIMRQSRPADRVVLCPVSQDDLPSLEAYPSIQVVQGGKGLTRQRNAILDAVEDCDILVFFDDDFFPSTDYLEKLEDIFNTHPDLVVATGQLIADGATGPGFNSEEGEHLLQTGSVPDPVIGKKAAYNGYGCNMSIRLAAVHQAGARFDENLPAYGWLEDLDFSRQLAPYGDILRFPQTIGVHLGTKRGRQSGRRLGYSQIANVVYLMRKGTCSSKVGLRTMSRNFAMNIARSLHPEPHVDRRGRLRGNLEAIFDYLTRRIDPLKIERM